MLVGIQVAVCMVLLISAGLLMRALYSAQTTDPDFQYRNVAVVSFSLRGQTTTTRPSSRFSKAALERIAALPGVDAVAQASKIPLSPGRNRRCFASRGGPVARSQREHGIANLLFSDRDPHPPRSHVHGAELDDAHAQSSSRRRRRDDIGRATIQSAERSS